MSCYLLNGVALVKDEVHGVERNTLELLRELDGLIEPGILSIVVPFGKSATLDFNNIEILECGKVDASELRTILWSCFGFVRYAKRHRYMTIDSTLSLPVAGCDILFLYDCIIEKYPQNVNSKLGRARRMFRIMRTRRCVQRAKAIVIDSESAKRDVMAWYACDSDKIHVIPCAWQHFSRVKADEAIIDQLDLMRGRYFFALGSRYFHKNLRWIVAAARQNPNYKFVVSGSGQESDGSAALPSNVVLAGYLSDGEVKALMMHCRAFVQPSLDEGFGIPPMEAMSVGAKCLVAHAGSLPEVYGGSVVYFDPTQYASIDIEALANTPVDGATDILEKYSWRKSANLLLELLALL